MTPVRVQLAPRLSNDTQPLSVVGRHYNLITASHVGVCMAFSENGSVPYARSCLLRCDDLPGTLIAESIGAVIIVRDACTEAEHDPMHLLIFAAVL